MQNLSMLAVTETYLLELRFSRHYPRRISGAEDVKLQHLLFFAQKSKVIIFKIADRQTKYRIRLVIRKGFQDFVDYAAEYLK